jgi:transketolase
MDVFDANIATSNENYTTTARQLAVDSILATTAAKSGHPTSSLSICPTLAVLLFQMRIDIANPNRRDNDRLVLSKGHAAPALYAAFAAAGAFRREDLLGLRKFGHMLQGHPVPRTLPGLVPFATGSLGLGLPGAVGIAKAMKHDGLGARCVVIVGDGEMREGSNYEALQLAPELGLDNLVAILDVNRFGQSGVTALEWATDTYAERINAFGWRTRVVAGGDFGSIETAICEGLAGNTDGKPTFIIAQTTKGYGVPLVANQPNWHGKPLSPDQAAEAIEALGGDPGGVSITMKKPNGTVSPGAAPLPAGKLELPRFEGRVATRKAFGDALVLLGAQHPELWVVDGDVGNSTFTEAYGAAFPDRFVQCGIAEQLMAMVGTGLATSGKKVVLATFGAFLARAFDCIRMAGISETSGLMFCGSHVGCSIGADGPSQMALEDGAMFRLLPPENTTVFYPADAISAARLLEIMMGLGGISYLRTTREATPLLYTPAEVFVRGGSKTLRSSVRDKATIITAGITVFEALKAADELAQRGINVRVIDAYSVQPIDANAVWKASDETDVIVTVEDHRPVGFLGDAVLETLAHDVERLAVRKLGVRHVPGSGEPAELMDAAGISARHIVETIVEALKAKGL